MDHRWDLILEYLFGAATVAVGWSGYVVSFLRDFGVNVPPQWYNAPGLDLVQVPGSDTWVQVTPQLGEQLLAQGINLATLPHATGVFNIVAASRDRARLDAAGDRHQGVGAVQQSRGGGWRWGW